MFIIGTTAQSLAGDFNIELFGRIIYGLGIGVAMHVAPLFIAETSPREICGKLDSLKVAAIVGGIVLGYAAGEKVYSSFEYEYEYEYKYEYEFIYN